VKVGDLVRVGKSGFGTKLGKRGLITEIVEYTRYGSESRPIPSAIVLFTTGAVILPLKALSLECKCNMPMV
jgi:hypothetical protein